MQILVEDKGTHLFSAPFLHQLIRNRDGMLGNFLPILSRRCWIPTLILRIREKADETFRFQPSGWMQPGK